MPDFQARREGWGNSFEFSPRFPRGVISTAGAPRFSDFARTSPDAVVAPHHVGSVGNGDAGPIQVFTDEESGGEPASVAAPGRALRSASSESPPAARCCPAGHGALVLEAEKMTSPSPEDRARHKRGCPDWVAGTLGTSGSSLRCNARAEKRLASSTPGDWAQTQLLRQASLPGAKPPLATPPRLRRVSRDHLNPQPLQRPPHLGSVVRGLTGPPAAGVGEKVARPIAVKRAESSLPFDHFPQPGHHRARRLLLHQLRVVGLAGGVIDDLDQVIPTLVLKPLMQGLPSRCGSDIPPATGGASAASGARPASAPSSPAPPLAAPALPTNSSARCRIHFPQLLMKVLYVQVRILLLI